MALLLALICLGISGGMTLVHTEDLGPLRTFHAGRNAFAHTAMDGTGDSCLACQWEASAYDPQLPAIPLARPQSVLMPLPASLSETVAPHPFDHTSPRARPRGLILTRHASLISFHSMTLFGAEKRRGGAGNTPTPGKRDSVTSDFPSHALSANGDCITSSPFHLPRAHHNTP